MVSSVSVRADRFPHAVSDFFMPLDILDLLVLVTLHGPINGACLGLMFLGFDGFFQDFIIVVIFLHIVIVF